MLRASADSAAGLISYRGLVSDLVPPGWPPGVLPPQAPEWERSAVAWLFDLCPPDYRAHEVLRRHPVVLAREAAASYFRIGSKPPEPILEDNDDSL